MASIVAQPKVVMNIVGASTAVANAEQKILVVGQKTSSGSAIVDTLLTAVDTSVSNINTLFGARSMIAGMLRSIRALNAVTQIDVFVLDDTGDDASEGIITFAGTVGAGNAGSAFVTIGSEVDYKLELSLAVADTPSTIGSKLTAAITAATNAPVTASDTTGVVTITAANLGVLGDQIGLEVDLTDVPDITADPAFTPMTGGTGTPDFAEIVTAIADIRYQTVIWPYADTTANLDSITDILDPRFNVDNKLLDGVAVATFSDADVITFTSSLTGLAGSKNSQSLAVFADKRSEDTTTTERVVFSRPAQFELDWIKSAQFGAIRALRLTTGQNISQFVTAANGPLDTIGGPALASKPYFNTPMPDLPSVPLTQGWSNVDIENLLTSGASIFGVNTTGTTAIVGEVVTTYKTDSGGNPDVSFKFLNFVDTSSNVREYYFNNNKSRFAQSRLTEGDVIRGRDMANANTIIAYQAQLFQDLSGENFVLLQAGEAALEFFKDSVVVSIDLTTGTATLQMTVPLVTQLREILGTIQIAFTTEG